MYLYDSKSKHYETAGRQSQLAARDLPRELVTIYNDFLAGTRRADSSRATDSNILVDRDTVMKPPQNSSSTRNQRGEKNP